MQLLIRLHIQVKNIFFNEKVKNLSVKFLNLIYSNISQSENPFNFLIQSFCKENLNWISKFATYIYYVD